MVTRYDDIYVFNIIIYTNNYLSSLGELKPNNVIISRYNHIAYVAMVTFWPFSLLGFCFGVCGALPRVGHLNKLLLV